MIAQSKTVLAAATATLLVATPQLEAQGISSGIPASFDSAQQRVPMLTRTDAAGLLAVSAVVLALMPNDRSIAAAFQRSSVQSNSTLKGGERL